MAEVYRNYGGRSMEKGLARHPGVQDYMVEATFEIGVRAEDLLLEHRQEGHASIEIENGRVDHYVILSDERGQKAALSIEYGRDAYDVTWEDKDGEEHTYTVGAMAGLYILHQAAHLRGGRKGKVKLPDVKLK
ncbi:DUF5403 family protein [Kribbella sp. NBC_01505]|uniref:DUF5403 family protein n=1 Tax=Kribbella sp. NBC_01505 TaxID=2903580 RepID=UPI00386FE9F8